METSCFQCLCCEAGKLIRVVNSLVCSQCGQSYTIEHGVPILLPQSQEYSSLRDAESHDLCIDQIRKTYDIAYSHDGLMGTDLDRNYDRITKDTLLNFASPLECKRILDVGTGIGNLWRYAPAKLEGYAIDVSLVGVLKAVQRFPHLTVSVSVAEDLPYPDEFFDAVVAADTLEHTLSPSRALQQIHRVLKPGGVLGASFPIPDSLRRWGWNQFVGQHPSPHMVSSLFNVMLKRTLLFGRPDFQPIDRDYSVDRWTELLQICGFHVARVVIWPEKPKFPIVTLVHAIRE